MSFRARWLFVLFAITKVSLSWAQSSSLYQNAAQFDCGGLSKSRASAATASDYQQLDRELSYANAALKAPAKLAGLYRYQDPYGLGEVLTIELRWISGRLVSRLVEWGEPRQTSPWSEVKLDPESLSRGYLRLYYSQSYPILIRPVAPGQLRYAFMDSCELNFPESLSKVFYKNAKIKAPKTIR